MRKARRMLAWVLMLAMILTSVPFSASKASAAEGEVVINALDYGADPTGASDSAQAIWEALEAAKAAEAEGKSVTLEFPEGEYHIYKDKAQTRVYHTSNTNSIENPTKTIGLLVEEHKNLTIDGNGSLFMMHGNMMALAVVKSENITLEDFSWDFAVPTVTEMTVVAVGDSYTDYYIPECFPYEISGNTVRWSSDLSPYTGEPYWTASGHHNTYAIIASLPGEEMTRNYGTGDGPFSNATSIEDLGNNMIRVNYSSRTSAQKTNQVEGALFALCGNAHRETAGAFTWESKNVLAERINVHFMHGFGWLIQMSTDVTYRECNLMPRENSGHVTVSFADGLHASGAAGEIVIENCNFSNTHDDPINFHGTFTRVDERIDAHTLELKYIHTQQGGFPQFHVGDQVQFFTRDTLESSDNETLYTVSEVVSNPGEDGNDLRTMIIRFEEELPEFLNDTVSNGTPKYVAENVTYAPAVTIKNSTFKNVPTRGILCTTRNKVLIEGNTFLNMSMATIFLSNDSNDWYESGPIRDMTIKNNTFYIKTIGDTYWDYKSAIYIHPVTYGGGLPSEDNPIHKNITIEGNTFHMSDDTVVKAESVENLVIRNNTILRTEPEFEIEISSGKDTLAAGESVTLNTVADGTTIIGDNNKNLSDTTSRNYDNVYEFTACKNVVLEGNTYDDGMKNYAVLSNMSDSNLTNNDADIKVVRSAREAADDPVSDLVYVSSDPEVVSVDADGKMTAKAAGMANVYAYYVWNGTVVKSNTITVTVAGESSESAEVAILNEGTVVLNDDTLSAKLEANTEVTWSAVDFVTGAATDVVAVSADGTVTAQKNGIAWVKAVGNGSEDQIPVVVSLTKCEGLAPGFTVVREDASHYTLDKNSLTIYMQAGDLWGTGENNLKNMFLYSEFDRDNVRTIVKVDNLPVNESGQWDTASFMFMKDEDNYITIGKKSHYAGITSVDETNGSANELGGSTTENAVTSAYLALTNDGRGTVSLDFKVEDGEWTHLRDLTASMLGDDYNIGFGAWHTNDRGKQVVFSDFKVGTADMSFAEVEALDAISIGEYENVAPAVSSVKFDKTSYAVNDTAKVTYTFSDKDGDAEGVSKFLWEYESEGETVSVVTESPEFTVRATGGLTCTVYPVDTVGTPGTPVSASTSAQQGDADLSLVSLKVNGMDVLADSNETEFEVIVPADITKAELSYQSLMASEGTTSVTVGSKTIAGAGNTDSLAVDIKDGDVITVKRSSGTEEIVYKITVNAVESNSTEIQGIEMSDLGFETDDLSEECWMVTTDLASSKIFVAADDTIGKIEVKYGYYRSAVEMEKTTGGYTGVVSFANGMNSIFVQVTAKDGITTKQYMVNVVYTPDNTAQLQSLKINGAQLEGFAEDTHEYKVVLPEDTKSLKVEAESDQSVRIRVNDTYIMEDSGQYTLETDELNPGTNDVYVVVLAADGVVRNTYHAAVILPHEANTEVSAVTVNGTDILDQFDRNGNAVMSVIDDQVDLEVTTLDEGAAVTIVTGAETIEGTGTASTTFGITEAGQLVEITITARDGKTTETYYLEIAKAEDPSSDAKDYPLDKITYSTGSEQSVSGDEGPIAYAFDGNTSTFWHSEWTPSWSTSQSEQYLWVEFDLEEAVYVDAIRYLPRGGNGDITSYRVEAKTAESGDEWVVLTEGEWDRNDTDWKLAQFESTEVTALRLVATGTYADSGNNKFASARELRVRTASPACEHVTKLVGAKEATCTADGYTGNQVCTICNAVVERGTKIPATGHTWGEWKVVKEATAAEAGCKERECSVCGEKEEEMIPANRFVDVTQDQYWYSSVMWAVAAGVTDGTSDTTFSPWADCTRGHVVTFLYRAMGCPEVTNKENPFVDVKEDAFYYDAVLWAVENGITEGTSDTTFDPGKECTRGQIVTFLYRNAGKPQVDTTVNPFKDVAADSYYLTSILWAVENGITDGTADDAFSPNVVCNRGQAVTFLYRSAMDK